MPTPDPWWRGRPHLTRLSLTGLALVTAVAGAGLGVAGAQLLAAPSGSCDTRAVAAKSLPAVVTIFVEGPSGSGSGSGAIIDGDGLIITNDHVIAAGVDSGTIEVLLNSGERVPSTLVGTDPMTDLALLRIDDKGLPTLTVAAREPLTVGQPVVALGAPLGLSGTVTSGIVSALNRSIPVPKAGGGTTVVTGAIQTDAAINPGNSGGPLVTCAGQLVGVNTAISTVPGPDGSAGGGSVGIGWAVPASTVQRISGELLANGRATHPWIGAVTAEIPPQVAAAFGVPGGLYVQSVTDGGPAAAAGLAAGDVILTVRSESATAVSLAWMLVTSAVGDEVPVTFLRGSARQETTLTLVEQP